MSEEKRMTEALINAINVRPGTGESPMPLRSSPWTMYQDQYESRRGVINLVLKERQVGFTTWCVAKALVAALAGGTAVTVPINKEHGEFFVSVFVEMYQSLCETDFALPGLIVKRSGHVAFDNGGCIHVAKPTTHGLTIDFLHIGEPNNASVLSESISAQVPCVKEQGEAVLECSISSRVPQPFWDMWESHQPQTKVVKHLLGCRVL